eukprot:Clim_evm53s191 gene=Clim_evmTU53s191
MTSFVRPPVQKLWAVTMVKGPARRSQDVKDALKSLGFTKRLQTVIHMNTPGINGVLRKVQEHIELKPIVFKEMKRSELKNIYEGQSKYFLNSKGEMIHVIDDETPKSS